MPNWVRNTLKVIARVVLTIEGHESCHNASEEQYLLAMRQRVDQLKARADLPHYKYATEDQPRLIAYFIKRAVQFGEAAYPHFPAFAALALSSSQGVNMTCSHSSDFSVRA